MSDSGHGFARTEREILVELRQDMKYVKKSIEAITENKVDRYEIMRQTEQVKDHESRLRMLENFRWWILGAMAGSAALSSAATKLIFR
jgi:hypothetical protein